MQNKKRAFTLVELIVVITILAILATVGFVSFSGYLAGTRDVNRISQLKSMSDAL
ncbi:MAG: type II secretion system protein [Candidatus Gracilibacteria bacterium]|nr:type II secretion system protein [Candidatus Gracilibacteria bacterium]MDQ7022177.1 type II secretion system protein [Candidatus Gracilibacteria bacterium]